MTAPYHRACEPVNVTAYKKAYGQRTVGLLTVKIGLSDQKNDRSRAYLGFSSFFFSSFFFSSFFSSKITTLPPFSLSFFSFGSSAKEGALNATATATAIIAINMRFIVCHPL